MQNSHLKPVTGNAGGKKGATRLPPPVLLCLSSKQIGTVTSEDGLPSPLLSSPHILSSGAGWSLSLGFPEVPVPCASYTCQSLPVQSTTASPPRCSGPAFRLTLPMLPKLTMYAQGSSMEGRAISSPADPSPHGPPKETLSECEKQSEGALEPHIQGLSSRAQPGAMVTVVLSGFHQ